MIEQGQREQRHQEDRGSSRRQLSAAAETSSMTTQDPTMRQDSTLTQDSLTKRDPLTTQEMMRASRRKWYANNQEHAKAKVVERRHDLQHYINALKSARACMYCGERHPACLDFYRRDEEGSKISGQSQWVLRKGWSRDRIDEQLAACDVLCANCVAKQSWDQHVHAALLNRHSPLELEKAL